MTEFDTLSENARCLELRLSVLRLAAVRAAQSGSYFELLRYRGALEQVSNSVREAYENVCGIISAMDARNPTLTTQTQEPH